MSSTSIWKMVSSIKYAKQQMTMEFFVKSFNARSSIEINRLKYDTDWDKSLKIKHIEIF